MLPMMTCLQATLVRKECWSSYSTIITGLVLEKDIRKRVRTCASCQFSTPRWHCPYGELQPLPVPQGAWQELTMNFITDLPPSRMRNGVFDSILVIVNRYLKMVSYIPAKKTWKAKDLADTFIERVISCFGPPKGIISD